MSNISSEQTAKRQRKEQETHKMVSKGVFKKALAVDATTCPELANICRRLMKEAALERWAAESSGKPPKRHLKFFNLRRCRFIPSNAYGMMKFLAF